MERFDVQHLKQCSLRSTNFLINFDQVDIAQNFNGSLCDLGGDGESLEERCLLRTLSSVTSGYKHIKRSNSTGFGRGFFLVAENDITNLTQIFIVFFPMRTSPLPRRAVRICCICLEPTLSAETMKQVGYSSINLSIRWK